MYRSQLALFQESWAQGNGQYAESTEDFKPIRCRCGFSHVLGDTVLCINPACSSWQHVVCYYGVDDSTVAPENHVCDRCRSVYPLGPLENAQDYHGGPQSAGEEALASDPHAEDILAFNPCTEDLLVSHSHNTESSSTIPDSNTERTPTSSNPRTEEAHDDAQEPGSGFRPRGQQVSDTKAQLGASIQPPGSGESQLHAIPPSPNAHSSFEESLAPFERQHAASNIQWTPESAEIQSTLKKIALQWFNISKSLIRDGYLLTEVPTLERLREQMHISSCLAYPHKESTDMMARSPIAQYPSSYSTSSESSNSSSNSENLSPTPFRAGVNTISQPVFSEPPSKRATERWLRGVLAACAVDWVFNPGQPIGDQSAAYELSSVSRLDTELNFVLAHSVHTELTARCEYTHLGLTMAYLVFSKTKPLLQVVQRRYKPYTSKRRGV